MGIMEDATAAALTQAWVMLPMDKRTEVKKGCAVTEVALHDFNAAIANDQITGPALEQAIKDVLAAMGTVGSSALQAMLWSVFKHA